MASGYFLVFVIVSNLYFLSINIKTSIDGFTLSVFCSL